MADEVAASTMVTYFTSCMAQLRGRAVYVQFSNHKELKTDQTHSNAVSIGIFVLSVVSEGVPRGIRLQLIHSVLYLGILLY
jgi:hypothetical protein